MFDFTESVLIAAPHAQVWEATRVSARVWATFPRHRVGRLAAFAFVHLLNGVQKDREHARTELRYLKGLIENPATAEAP